MKYVILTCIVFILFFWYPVSSSAEQRRGRPTKRLETMHKISKVKIKLPLISKPMITKRIISY